MSNVNLPPQALPKGFKLVWEGEWKMWSNTTGLQNCTVYVRGDEFIVVVNKVITYWAYLTVGCRHHFISHGYHGLVALLWDHLSMPAVSDTDAYNSLCNQM